MSIFQITFAALILLAIWAGRPHPRIAAAIVVNFLCSVALSKAAMPDAERLIWVGTVDLCTVAAMWGISARGNIAAALYGCMVMTYPVAIHLELSEAQTYTVIEALGALALAVIGGLDRGTRRLYRAARLAFGRAYRHGYCSHSGVPQRVSVQPVSQDAQRW